MIPLTCHQIWMQGTDHLKRENPKRFQSVQDTKAKLEEQGFTHRIWSEVDIVSLLTPQEKRVYDRIQAWACKADIGRLVVLRKHGGLYLDVDYQIWDDIKWMLHGNEIHTVVSGYDTSSSIKHIIGNFNNCCFAAAPGSPVVTEMLRHIASFETEEQPLDHSFASILHNTGPNSVGHAVKRVYGDAWFDHHPGLRILPHSLLDPYVLGTMNRTATRESFPTASAIHLVDQSWGGGNTARDGMSVGSFFCDYGLTIMIIQAVIIIIMVVVIIWLALKLKGKV